MKRSIINILAVATLATSAGALNITLTPGALKLDNETICTTSDSQLTLTGEANVTDLLLLNKMSRNIRTLDMSNLNILPYTYEKGDYMGQTSFAAGELPAYMLFDTRVTTVKLPSNTIRIDAGALANTDITSINIPASVTTIGDNAFSGCSRIKTVTINAPVTLGNNTFRNCTALTQVNFNSDINNIPSGTFEGCTALDFSIPSTVTTIGDHAFTASGITEANLTNAISVGDYAFANCKDLKEIVFSNGANTKLGTGVFFNDPTLADIIDWTSNVPDLFVANSSSASTSNILNSSEIGAGAFANNEAIQSVTLGENVRSVKAYAFRNAKNLSSVDVSSLGNSIPETDPDAFSGLENELGKYPISLYVARDSSPEWLAHNVWGRFNIETRTDVNTLEDITEPHVSISRRGSQLTITSHYALELVNIYDLSGLSLVQARPMTDVFVADELPSDAILVVRIMAGGKTRVVKIAAN